MRNRSRGNAFLVLVIMAFTTAMCRSYDEQLGFVTYQNGWSCQTYTEYFGSGLSVENGHECQVICANGTAGPPRSVQNPLELEHVDLRAFCGVAAPTATEIVITATDTATPRVHENTGSSPTAQPPATSTRTATRVPLLPLLTEEMTSCGNNNQLGWWVNFRLAEPRQELSNRDLEVTIGGLETPCGINQENPSLLTCFAPSGLTYPADVVVKLDGSQVNNFRIMLNQSACSGATPTSTGGDRENPTPDPGSPTGVPPTEPPAATSSG